MLLLGGATCSSSNHAGQGSDGAVGGTVGAGTGGVAGHGGVTGTGGTGGSAGTGTTASGGSAGTAGTAGLGGAAGSEGPPGFAGSGGRPAGVAGNGGGSGGSTGMGGAPAGTGGAEGAGETSPPTCSLTCAVHQTCVVQGSTPTCVCVAGYQMSASGCVWGTVPADPGFQNIPAGAWTLAQGATLDPSAAGFVDPGEVDLAASALCTGGGWLGQSISMPTVAQSEPFAIKMVSNRDCSLTGAGCRAVDPVVIINGGVIAFRDGPINHAACLGERAYGGTIDLVIRPPDRASCVQADAIVDHLDIEPSSTCPVPGTIPDGDFDGMLGTWKTWTQADAPTTVAEIAPTVGTAGTAGAHLAIHDACDEAAAHQLISPPLSLPNLALQLRFRGTAGATARVLVDNLTTAVLTGTGAQVTGNVCLLESHKGMTQDLLLGLGDFGFAGSLTCSTINQDFVLDDLTFVSDPSCPSTAYLADGGFERTDPGAAWDTTLLSDSVEPGRVKTRDPIGIDTTPANVHSGQRALKIVNSDSCGANSATFAIAVPPPAPGAGPAVAFFYKAPAVTTSGMFVTVAGVTITPPAAANYTRAQICLDPTMAGQTVMVEAGLGGRVTNGVCGSIPAETAWFDDFTVTTSAACPTD